MEKTRNPFKTRLESADNPSDSLFRYECECEHIFETKECISIVIICLRITINFVQSITAYNIISKKLQDIVSMQKLTNKFSVMFILSRLIFF